jgi:phosphoribosylformimino-5-aminoimidazole carboxamide ribonucleotide (ProFAR) isomerase
VALEVIPAVDVASGRLARPSRDGLAEVEAFGGDPIAAAIAFVEAGARRLHVVDVDLASTGVLANLGVLREIANLGVPVQASGGLVSEGQVETVLDAGANRAVLGSAALADRARVESIVASRGEAIAIGIEADGARIVPRGTATELPLWETLAWLGTLEVRRFIYTEVRRVGGLGGPDLDGIWALAIHTATPVVAAGGIRDVRDLRAVAKLGGRVEGAVVGRALYEGLDLREAIAAVA